MDRSDQVFQYPDIQQTDGEVLPYMFEPQADEANGPAGSMSDDSSSGSDDYDSSGTESEEGDADDNPERIGNTDWCSCGHCIPMPTGTESICCHEILRVRIKSGNLPCITLHEGFEAICLNAHVIESSIYQYIDEEGGYVDDRATFELFRYVSYRQFVRWVWQRLGRHRRKVLPSCVVNQIRISFPSEEHKGFRYPHINY